MEKEKIEKTFLEIRIKIRKVEDGLRRTVELNPEGWRSVLEECKSTQATLDSLCEKLNDAKKAPSKDRA